MIKYLLISLAALLPFSCSNDTSTIGGTPVPNDLHCAEDEVIGFDGIPDTLICIHIDDL